MITDRYTGIIPRDDDGDIRYPTRAEVESTQAVKAAEEARLVREEGYRYYLWRNWTDDTVRWIDFGKEPNYANWGDTCRLVGSYTSRPG